MIDGRRKMWLWATLIALPLAVAGVVYGQTLVQRRAEQAPATAAYTCPMTGQKLPCPKCCPLNAQK